MQPRTKGLFRSVTFHHQSRQRCHYWVAAEELKLSYYIPFPLILNPPILNMDLPEFQILRSAPKTIFLNGQD